MTTTNTPQPDAEQNYGRFETHCPTCRQRFGAGRLNFRRIRATVIVVLFGLLPTLLAVGFMLGRLSAG